MDTSSSNQSADGLGKKALFGDLLSELLKISSHQKPLKQCLEEALRIILKAQFAVLKDQGAIFLANSNNTLELAIQHNLALPLLEMCAQVPFGHCLCGRAAETKAVIHASDIDHRHETTFEGIKPHGHYNVPLISHGVVIGVLVLYLSPGHVRSEEEVGFLEAVALVLVGIIVRKRYEEVRTAQDKVLMDNLPHRIYYKDSNSVYVSCNKLFSLDVGLKMEDIPGLTDSEIFGVEAADGMEMEDQTVMSTGIIIEQDEVREIAGNDCYCHRVIAPVTGEDGSNIGVLGLYWDVSEAKLAEQKLEESEAKYSSMVNSAKDAIVMIDNNDRILFWNLAAESMFGFKSDEVLGQSLHGLIAPKEFRSAFESGFLKFRESGKGPIIGETVEIEAQKKGGERIPVEISVSAAMLKGEWNAIGSIRDISERKEDEKQQKLMEQQLRQSQKLESIGQLAAGIAHEINTPTQFIGDNCNFVRDGVDDLVKLLEEYENLVKDAQNIESLSERCQQVQSLKEDIDLEFLVEEIPQALDQSLEGVNRVTKIVRAMKEFSHPGSVERAPVDINAAINMTFEVSRNEWKYVATTKASLDPNLPQVEGVAEELNQAFLNLIVNAAQAIEETIDQNGDNSVTGMIEVVTENHDEYIVIKVIDNGVGMSAEVKERAFDHFFTTKAVGKGTGQGLSLVYAIVERHQGSIDIESEEGKGTTFRIMLPVDTE